MHHALASRASRATAARSASFDSTLALRADPYRAIGRMCRALGSPAVTGRLLLQPAVFLSGVAAARMFYQAPQLVRHGAAPEPILATLLGRHGVQTLDGAAHQHRKAMFLAHTSGAAVLRLRALAAERWDAAMAPAVQAGGTVALYPLAQAWLFDCAWRWAGVPLPTQALARWRDCTAALFDSAANGLAGHLHARVARRWLELQLAQHIVRARQGAGPFAADSPAQAIALHRDPQGALLPAPVAATELLNLLRPIVAVAVYVVFVAHALALRPGLRAWLDQPAARLAFLQEVRRFYPFFPAVPARVRQAFAWRGVPFARGARVLLDLYGTNHDPVAWPEPQRFMPGRFGVGMPDRHAFVPQGGGDAASHHRCPGEDVALALMDVALQRLLAGVLDPLPAQDLSLDMRRLPALPRDGLRVQAARLLARREQLA